MEPSRIDFGHPYEPYDIQLEFMQQLYQCIQSGDVAIFESPTGTGKSLSLICGSLTWLRDHARQQLQQSIDQIDQSDWLAVAEATNQQRRLQQEHQELEQRLASLRNAEILSQKSQSASRPPKRSKTVLKDASNAHISTDNDFALQDYEESEHVPPTSERLSSVTQSLLDQLKPKTTDREADERCDRTQIIFCSRTHSQLTQFIHELTRVAPPPAFHSIALNGEEQALDDTVKHVALGSRKNLCINPKVNRLSSTLAINERCLEMQKPGFPKGQRCQFLPSKDNSSKVDAFSDRAIAKIRDIEDTANLGREMGICPYYATRNVLPNCEVVTLPYPLLLQQAARDALGVNVKGNVIVIDEAHNLIDAIADTMSMSLSLSNIDLATRQTTVYVQRFKSQLKGANRMYITQILRLMNALSDFLRSCLKDRKQSQVAVTAGQLMSGKGVDQIQPHKLLEYLKNSKLVYKVEGYTELHSENGASPRGALLQVQSFLAVLVNPDAEGSFFVERHDQDILVKYTLLDPRQHFKSIVEDARAVILAGGTMSPMSDYANHLFSYLDPVKLKTFSFGHVIPKGNLFVKSITEGPYGVEFDYTYSNRSSEHMIAELGELVHRVCATVPDGVVVFFPSYEYLAIVTSIWKRQSAKGCIFDRLNLCKRIFEESRGVAVDSLLRDFSEAIHDDKGGLMLSVIGGKLSEGINFSDRLGRAVLAVGLPFPNIQSAEWKARIEYIEKTHHDRSKAQGLSEDRCKHDAKAAGREFYENVCMRSINQSIGRAIRHKNDYAAILLIDRRFSTDRIKKKLPQWILSNMNDLKREKWEAAEGELRQFFRTKAISTT